MEERISYLRDRYRKCLSRSFRTLGGLRKSQVPFDAYAFLLEPRLHFPGGMRNR